ncbi:MAG TPA: GntR family transcriptional regulator [Syntrophomonadaceae bacterium]|nr:GntR family transcriptional regulator [Syntrophomonadaceae bacterium]
MWLDIDPRSSTPIYVQLVQRVKEAVARGFLRPGDRMPTVRELASLLMINPNTIAKAYQRLEQEGIIETMRSRGTFVAVGSVQINKEQGRKKLTELIHDMLVEAYYLGISNEELQSLFMNSLQDWENRKGEQ